METKRLLNEIIRSAADLKALDIVDIDVEGRSSLAEFIVICHGTSTAHTKGIADRIDQNLKKNKILPLRTEGYEVGEWILIDYNSIIVHLFLEEVRHRYSLEEIFNPRCSPDTGK
ncbi:MAG: ribosome silencing factor [Proteobacteria bacterium]|nr:ribosome silencing factor [Pseudomonadota bacterium]